MPIYNNRKIVWLASYPRSGNTFFRILLKRIYGTRNTSIYEEDEIPEIEADEASKHNELECRTYRDLNEYLFVKTHELPKDSSPTVYLVRDGRDALISYAWYILTVEKVKSEFHDVLKDLILNTGFFGGWSNHVMAWTARPAMTAVVRFEDIISLLDPEPLVSDALEKLKFKIRANSSRKQIPSFAELQRKNPLQFRKGKIGSWVYEMPKDLHELFWDIHGIGMEKMGYAYK